MRDYHATVKIQQGRLRSAMVESGIKSARELAIKSGQRQNSIGNLLNFKLSPKKKDGQWRTVVLAVSQVLNKEPDELFPVHLQHEVSTNVIESYVEERQLMGDTPLQLNPSHSMEQDDVREVLDEMLDDLSPQQREVLEKRFCGEQTLEQVGEGFGVSRERVRNIETEALRKLRNPVRMGKFEQAFAGLRFEEIWDQ